MDAKKIHHGKLPWGKSIPRVEREAAMQEALEINGILWHLRSQQLKVKNNSEVLNFGVLVDSTDDFRDRKKKEVEQILGDECGIKYLKCRFCRIALNGDYINIY